MMLNLHERAKPEHSFQAKWNNTSPSTLDFFGYRIDIDPTDEFGVNDSA